MPNGIGGRFGAGAGAFFQGLANIFAKRPELEFRQQEAMRPFQLLLAKDVMEQQQETRKRKAAAASARALFEALGSDIDEMIAAEGPETPVSPQTGLVTISPDIMQLEQRLGLQKPRPPIVIPEELEPSALPLFVEALKGRREEVKERRKGAFEREKFEFEKRKPITVGPRLLTPSGKPLFEPPETELTIDKAIVQTGERLRKEGFIKNDQEFAEFLKEMRAPDVADRIGAMLSAVEQFRLQRQKGGAPQRKSILDTVRERAGGNQPAQQHHLAGKKSGRYQMPDGRIVKWDGTKELP